MRYLQILLEYNLDRLINDFSQKLLSRWIDDDTTPDLDGDKETLPKQIIELISESDPTPNKEYTFWLVNRYANKGINLFEDITTKAAPTLAKYHKLKITKKLKLEHRDINQIKTLGDLMDITDTYPNVESKREITDATEQRFYNSNQAELIYNDAQVRVVMPKSEEASCYFGINTRWCTAAKFDNRFKQYTQYGPLYIILIKAENKRYQFHFQTHQFMDEQDKRINPRELADKYPILWKIFEPICLRGVADRFKFIILVKDMPEKEQIKIMTANPIELMSCSDPITVIKCLAATPRLMTLANYKMMSNIKNYGSLPANSINEHFIGEIIKINSRSFETILKTYVESKEPKPFPVNDYVNNIAVQAWPGNLQFIPWAKEETQILAVKLDPSAIRYCKNPTPKVQYYGYALQISKDPSSIKKIREPSLDLQKLAVTRKPAAIIDITKPHPEVIKIAKEKGGPDVQRYLKISKLA